MHICEIVLTQIIANYTLLCNWLFHLSLYSQGGAVSESVEWFALLNNSMEFHWATELTLKPSSFDGYLGCFKFFSIVNNAVIHIHILHGCVCV